MIVADTSALISLATVDLIATVLSEFDVHTTETVIDELETTSEYDDSHGDAAQRVLAERDRLTIHRVDDAIESSRVDVGEGSCGRLSADHGASFLLTDDLRALPELQTVVDADVAISPIVLKALVQRDVLSHDDAVSKVETLADRRDWLGAPIYRRAKALFN
ncbi:hypothetical protein EGH24_00090 [Halonotius terrestris]|uniref:Uncharacterized protein n=1 Tax=Halonotius terrestris TaxID=2487750 RepID=A0A8J8TDJ5_9EURY|nr:hypothetical protein [Halonotius terrestris]TQQ83244.1 hypothetical protein EGH24_00090 [Halonotius terrestris]